MKSKSCKLISELWNLIIEKTARPEFNQRSKGYRHKYFSNKVF